MTSLKEELTDPRYLGMTDEEAAVDLNTLRIFRNRTSMTGLEVAYEIDEAEYAALTNSQKSQVLTLTLSESLDPFGLAAHVIKDIFPASTTLTNLAAARIEQISRAVELGIRSPIHRNHIHAART